MRRGFQAVFVRFGKAILPNGYIKRYMFLVNVRDDQGRHVTLHMWMPMRAEDYVWAQLHEGDVISFTAEVEVYFKGPPKHRRMDYGLCRPRDVERVEDVVYDTQE